MTDARRVPKEETSFEDSSAQAVEDAATSDDRDRGHEPRTAQSGDSPLNPDEQGWFGDLKQNLTNRWSVRESSAVPRD